MNQAVTMLGREWRSVRIVTAKQRMTVSRKELISFAMDYWPQEAIEEALGDDLAKGIPKLLRLADLHVRIPRFEIVALERLAERDDRSIDAILASELLDIVSAESDFFARRSPALPPRFGDRSSSRCCRRDCVPIIDEPLPILFFAPQGGRYSGGVETTKSRWRRHLRDSA